jgi:hypothetical protein
LLDRVLSGAGLGQIAVLSSMSFVCLLLLAILRYCVSGDGFHSALFWALVSFLDPVHFADEESFGKLFIGLLASLSGLGGVASLIGLVSTSLEARLQAMKKGKSRVVASGHMGILLKCVRFYFVLLFI